MSQHLDYPYPAPAHWPVPQARACSTKPASVPRTVQRPRRLVSLATQLLGLGLLAAATVPTPAAELNEALQRLATCQDSWLDWRRDEAAMRRFGQQLMAQFRHDDKRQVWLPQGSVQWLGLEVTEVTPQSMGMALGFGLTLKGRIDDIRPAYERVLGRAMEGCAKEADMSSCELRLGDKKTAVVMAPTRHADQGALMGCYYYYAP
jgi:hypothetical protein